MREKKIVLIVNCLLSLLRDERAVVRSWHRVGVWGTDFLSLQRDKRSVGHDPLSQGQSQHAVMVCATKSVANL